MDIFGKVILKSELHDESVDPILWHTHYKEGVADKEMHNDQHFLQEGHYYHFKINYVYILV